MPAKPMSDWILPLLRCPVCARPLRYAAFERSSQQGWLTHESNSCMEQYPVIDGIPRLLVGSSRGNLVRAHPEWFADLGTSLAEGWASRDARDPVITGFDDEWRHFRDVGRKDQSQVYALYFDLVPPDRFGRHETVLDAGCGAGRWAFEVARRGPRVIAVDLGMSIEIARENTTPDRVACVQADVTALPLAPEAVDWAYSLGVLHHTNEPERALSNIVEAVRPGGLVLLYLYYALDQRGLLFRALLTAVDLVRRFVSRQPRTAARIVAALIAAFVYWPCARSAALFERAGARALAAKLPLNFYRHLAFETMRNDSLDRFGTRLERRYTQVNMVAMMRRAGLVDVVISDSPPFWHGIGVSQPDERARS